MTDEEELRMRVLWLVQDLELVGMLRAAEQVEVPEVRALADN